jgi:hypothetical protein
LSASCIRDPTLGAASVWALGVIVLSLAIRLVFRLTA